MIKLRKLNKDIVFALMAGTTVAFSSLGGTIKHYHDQKQINKIEEEILESHKRDIRKQSYLELKKAIVYQDAIAKDDITGIVIKLSK